MKNIAEILKGGEGAAFMTLPKSAMQLRRRRIEDIQRGRSVS
jgi:hypothetical protein